MAKTTIDMGVADTTEEKLDQILAELAELKDLYQEILDKLDNLSLPGGDYRVTDRLSDY